jgi:hypothetical protein
MAQWDLREHQWKAVNQAHNGCIIRGDPGSGKTMVGLMYYYMKECKGRPHGFNGLEYKRMEDPKNLYVITTARKRNDGDWEEEAARFGIGRKANENGVQLHVDSWNNIADYEDVTDAFFIFDEARNGGTGRWSKLFLEIAKKNRWILLSGTPGDVWMDFVPVFIANGFFKNRSQFVDNHVEYDRYAKYPKVKRYHHEAYLAKLRSQIMVDMPFTRHTRRHVRDRLVTYDKALYDDSVKRRWNPYTNEPMKDAAEMFRVMRKIVNSDVSRLGGVLKEMEKHPRMIIFYNFDYELDMLRTLWSTTGIVQKEWNGHKHESVPDGDEWLYLVQYSAGNEAWNCITTDTILFWSQNYSYKVTEQAKGRIDRLNTPYIDLNYIFLMSDSSIDKAIGRSLVTKKDFNEKYFLRSKFDGNSLPLAS